MISHPINRVQAIKSKFENLNSETASVKQKLLYKPRNECERKENKDNSFENDFNKYNNKANEIQTDSSDDNATQPNSSSLYKIEVKRSASDSKTTLTRQISDPGKKLHRSHAFRCDRSQKLHSPKRHGSCNGRSETSEFLKMERKLSKDRLKRLGNVLEQQMKKENFTFSKEVGEVKEVLPCNSVADEDVPPHILAQYAQVIKPKKNDDKLEAMTDSGVSSETENLEEEKNSGRVRKITSQFETIDKEDVDKTNLDIMEDLAGSSETMKLERKNPHLILTDTLKKALKQPLPPGPPPKKPPRTIIPPDLIEKEKSDAKRKLEKLEQVLMKREARKEKNIYDIAEENLNSSNKKPKEIHYLCTEILDITQRTLLPNTESPLKSCLNKLNCSVTTNSMSSLPYTRLSSNFDTNVCTCSQENVDKDLRTFMSDKCSKCHNNDDKNGFKCHLKCKCKTEKSEFFVDEHIYDEPYVSSDDVKGRKSEYGTLNSVKIIGSLSKSLEDIRKEKESSPVYDTPCDQLPLDEPKTEFQKLRDNFESNCKNETQKLSKVMAKSTENIFDDQKFKKRSPERKFATEVKKYKPKESVGFSLPKRNPQLDVDRENLNRLMNEIYETVTAACIMEENKPGSFPTDHSETTSEESAKLTRSLTEKRKNYVRRVSSRLAYLEPKNIKQTRYRHQTSICSYKSELIDNPYSTFRSWKSFRTSQNNLTRGKMETDSKFNLTDSKGNILSLKNDFDIDSVDNLSIDEKTGCVDIELPFEAREGGLFNVCLVVGLNYMTGEAYVRSVFPNQVQVPQHIENLVFPETLVQDKDIRSEWCTDAASTQCYSFVLTDERGERSYGYCRRVLPEGATSCLPLSYCLIGKYRAPGFYYKVLQELESHHGSSEERINSILQQLFDLNFPLPGEEITINYPKLDFTAHNSPTDLKEELLKEFKRSTSDSKEESKRKDSKNSDSKFNIDLDDSKDSKNSNSKFKIDLDDSKDSKNSDSILKNDLKAEENESFLYDLRNFEAKKLKSQFSVPDSSKFRDVANKCKTLPDMRRSDVNEYEYCDIENNNGPLKILLNLDSSIRSKTLKCPLDPRAEETSASQLLDSLGAGLLIKVFGSLLLERKVIIRADKLSLVSSHLEALQASLYPFVWQQPLISLVPREIQQELLHAPVPMLAGMLNPGGVNEGGFEEGMFVDLTIPTKVLFYQGDESTILPTSSYKTLKTSLQMESSKNKEKGDTKTRNLLISETFLRFFVDILGDFWKYFSVGVLKEGDLGREGVVFDKEAFIKNATSKQNQCFLEWFTETAMFNHFIQNMAVRYRESYSDSKVDSKIDHCDSKYKLIDTPTPNFYQLFEERVLSRRNSKGVDRSGYKNALNKRVRLLKARLKELVG